MDSCCRERPDCPEKPGLVDPAGNRWHHAANVWRIDCVLDHEEEVTVAEVVKVTGLTADTVLRHLHSLAETGHAERVNRTTWRGALAAPGADEQAKDGIDHRTYRKARHQAEREKWAAYKAARIAALDEGKTTTERAAPAAAVGARCPDGNLRRPRNGRDSHRKSYCRKISESGVTTTLLPPPASVTLRDYQIDALDAVEARDAAGIHRQLIAVPTGCGKTIIFGEVIRRRPGRALVLRVPR